jgi:hypothetical protein
VGQRWTQIGELALAFALSSLQGQPVVERLTVALTDSTA